MPNDLQLLADQTLESHMASVLQLEVIRDGAGVRIAEMDALFSVAVEDVPRHGSDYASFVFANVQFGLGQTISELMMGAGHTAEEAVVFAVHDLVESVLKPIVMLCVSSIEPAGASTMVIEDDAREWVMVQGVALNNDYSGVLTKFLQEKTPCEMVLERLNSHFEPEQLHWIKVYRAKMGEQEICEVRIDNEVDEELSESLLQVPLPALNPLMYRQFAIVAPSAWATAN